MEMSAFSNGFGDEEKHFNPVITSKPEWNTISKL